MILKQRIFWEAEYIYAIALAGDTGQSHEAARKFACLESLQKRVG